MTLRVWIYLLRKVAYIDISHITHNKKQAGNKSICSSLSGSISGSGSSSAVIRVGTKDHGREYRCVSNTPYVWFTSFEVQVEGT